MRWKPSSSSQMRSRLMRVLIDEDLDVRLRHLFGEGVETETV